MPDPVPESPNGERRRCARQKLHTPIYASFNGSQSGMVVDLSELLDLHEEGFAVQTSERLETNRAVTICLDLPETRSFIHGSGEVVWSDDTGRGGIRFSALSENSRRVLKQWLFANLLIACSNHAARTEQLARREQEKSTEPGPVVVTSTVTNAVSNAAPSVVPNVVPYVIPNTGNVVPISDGSAALALVEAIRSEVRKLGDDADAVFQFVTECAMRLTGASATALAFLTDDIMIWRARAGEPAPPFGAPVDVSHGLSGECVRSGLLVSCEDMENDPRIDPEIGRALGIGSLMAAPIVSDFRVVGLLEVFSPHPHAFVKTHETVLERLVEMIPKVRSEKARPETAGPVQAVQEPPVNLVAVSHVSLHQAPESTPIEPGPARSAREALPEEKVQVADQILAEVHRQVVSDPVPDPDLEPVPDQVPDRAPKSARARPSSMLHLGLLGLAVAVVAMAVGYLAAPVIERWSAARQAPLRGEAQTVAAANTTARVRTEQHAQPTSLAELRNLADHGDADAQWQMGVRYADGEGVPKDDSQAMLWFQLAAEQGHVNAQAHLGAYYWAGRGVPEDLSKAYMWSDIALAGGDENSKSRLEGLASQMTRQQVSAASQQAEVWIRQHSATKSARN
jgi:hypothetical protein